MITSDCDWLLFCELGQYATWTWTRINCSFT